MSISLYDLDDRYALLWADERSRLPADHPQHITAKAREVIFRRALAGMERQCDEMIEAVLRELGNGVLYRG